jgi:hypothetical protein
MSKGTFPLLASLILFLIPPTVGASASSPWPKGLNEYVASVKGSGIDILRTEKDHSEALNVRCDQESVLKSLIAVKPWGTTVDERTLHEYPYGAAYQATLWFLAGYLSRAYGQDPDLDVLSVEAEDQTRDIYGHAQLHKMFSLKFTRRIYARIEWLHFKTDDLPEISERFLLGNWFQQHLKDEDARASSQNVPGRLVLHCRLVTGERNFANWHEPAELSLTIANDSNDWLLIQSESYGVSDGKLEGCIRIGRLGGLMISPWYGSLNVAPRKNISLEVYCAKPRDLRTTSSAWFELVSTNGKVLSAVAGCH